MESDENFVPYPLRLFGVCEVWRFSLQLTEV